MVAAILDEDAAAVLSLVSQIAEHAPDFVSTLDELSNILHQMTVAQTVPDALDTSGRTRRASLNCCTGHDR